MHPDVPDSTDPQEVSAPPRLLESRGIRGKVTVILNYVFLTWYGNNWNEIIVFTSAVVLYSKMRQLLCC